MAVAPPEGAMGQRALMVFVPRIQGYDIVFILDIVVNHALAVTDGVLRPAAHRDCR